MKGKKEVGNAADEWLELWWNAKHVLVPEGEVWDEKGRSKKKKDEGVVVGLWGTGETRPRDKDKKATVGVSLKNGWETFLFVPGSP